MRTAEIIIKEYLESGYSVESLRVLAESRSEPLCSEMLAILRTMEDASEVPCECAPAAAEEIVFFVAGEDEPASGENAVDFDAVEAEPANAEESVAEIVVGESEMADTVPQTGLGAPEGMEKVHTDRAVWSKRWHAAGSMATSVEEIVPLFAEDETCGEAGVLEQLDALLAEEQSRASKSAPAMTADSMPTEQEAVEIEPEAERVVSDLAETATSGNLADLMDSMGVQTDASTDYIPGSVMVGMDEEDATALHEDNPEPHASETADDSLVAQESAAEKSRPVETADNEQGEYIAEQYRTEEMDGMEPATMPQAEQQAADDNPAAQESAAEETQPVETADSEQDENITEENRTEETDGMASAAMPQAEQQAADDNPVAQESAAGETQPVETADSEQDENITEENRTEETDGMASAAMPQTEQQAADDNPVTQESAVGETQPVETADSEQDENITEENRTEETDGMEPAAMPQAEQQAADDNPVTQESAAGETQPVETADSEQNENITEENRTEEADGMEPAAMPQAEVAEPQAALENTPAPVQETASEPTGEADATPPPALAVPTGMAATDQEKKESRKERRRRDRAEKKKIKAQKKQERQAALAGHELPEIVLTRSEGTDTLMPLIEDMTGGEQLALPEPTTTEETAGASAPETGSEAVLPGREEKAPGEAGPDDHAMIIAGGGLDLRSDAYRLLSDASDMSKDELNDYEPAGEAAAQSNVILFRATYPVYDEDESEEEGPVSVPPLRMLTSVETADENEVAETGETASEGEGGESPAATALTLSSETPAPALPPIARLGLLRAVSGMPEAACADESATEEEHIILPVPPEPEADNAEALARAAREELEQEYQQRLDEFAKRLLELQATVVANQTLARSRKDEIEAREKQLAELRKALEKAEESRGELARKLDDSRKDIQRKQARLDGFKDVLEEHERLYKEFEDLRLAYNEVVTDVMPGLQNERDDLALTVERQCEAEANLKSSLGSARRRLAVGYSLGAAACAMLVALPVFNWFKADDSVKELASGHQQVDDLMERLEKAERRNVDNDTEIFNLKRQINEQLAQLEEKNEELNNLSDKRAMQQAMNSRAGNAGDSGTPVRVTDVMALSGPSNSDGLLRYNDVRDPGNRIDEVVEANRVRRQQDSAPAGRNTGRQAVQSRVRLQPSAASPAGAATALRPPAAQQGNARGAQSSTAAAQQGPKARQGEILATVKSGDSVALMVFRELGTRSPEVIDWVIRENNLKKDRRGNPRIYPDQQLRLPKDGRITQSASASRR